MQHYHSDHAKVYNLCGEPERQYDASVLGLPPHLLEQYIAYDHNPCPLFCMEPFLTSVQRWLGEHADNVAVIHCKAGKGRTGMLICAYLVWSGACKRCGVGLIWASPQPHAPRVVPPPPPPPMPRGHRSQPPRPSPPRPFAPRPAPTRFLGLARGFASRQLHPHPRGFHGRLVQPVPGDGSAARRGRPTNGR